MKAIISLILIAQTIFACALCTVYSPKTRVVLDIKTNESVISEIDVKWILTKPFTDTLKNVYDINLDNNLDKTELATVKDVFLSYVKPKNYLSHISYGKKINKIKSNQIKASDLDAYIDNDILHFSYKIRLNYKIVKDNILYFSIEDNEQFFLIELEKNGITFDKEIFQENIIDLNSVSFYIIKEFVSEKQENIVEVKKENIIKADENFLTKFNKKIKENLIEIKNGNNIALITLLFVSFLYGIVHALGPGHGKSLAFSYFMATKSSCIKAFVISQVTAFIHIVGALILVLISIFIIESFFNSFVNDSIKLITKLSALFIMLLALYLLYKKYKNKSSSSPSCCSHHHEEKSTKKQDIFFVLTAGIIPCPGTVILFLYAFILKTYFAVILASIFISLGMGMVIFMSSFFSIKINKLTNNYQKVKNFIEIASPIFIFILGLLLFFNTNII
ncbi:hypothetical protein [Arcobacter sp.]|uniref:HoxN/HupN/NixA family nickel/cobalt transporter n=1 Tax=Arcobacter sp. TaxID=1872629 RepID=UPI003D0AA78C